jgi:hypothetical protein
MALPYWFSLLAGDRLFEYNAGGCSTARACGPVSQSTQTSSRADVAWEERAEHGETGTGF